MKLLNSVLTALLGTLLPLVLGSANLTAPIANYGVENFTWSIQPNISGASRTSINGSLEEVLGYLNSTYDNYPFPTFPDFNTTDRGNDGNGTSHSFDSRDVLTAPKSNGTVSHCFNFPVATGWRTYQNVQYLLGLDGVGTNGPGPGNCGRVACQWGSAIWWCNDNSESYTTSFRVIGNGAWDILINCFHSDWGTGTTSGQNFFDEGWNIIVRDGNC